MRTNGLVQLKEDKGENKRGEERREEDGKENRLKSIL